MIELFNTSVDPSMEYQRMRDLGTDSTLHVIVAFSPKKEYRFITEDQREIIHCIKRKCIHIVISEDINILVFYE